MAGHLSQMRDQLAGRCVPIPNGSISSPKGSGWIRSQNAVPTTTSAASPALAPVGTVADSINWAMRSGLQTPLFCAAVVFLAACQSPPVNQGTQPNKAATTAAPPPTPSSYEVDAFDPFRRDSMGLRGSSYFGRGP
jgi:hypothetical protein